MDVTFKDVVKHNNKTNVVLVGPNNISLDSMVCNFDCNTMILDRTLMLVAIDIVQGSQGRDNTTHFTSFVLREQDDWFGTQVVNQVGRFKVLLKNVKNFAN